MEYEIIQQKFANVLTSKIIPFLINPFRLKVYNFFIC